MLIKQTLQKSRPLLSDFGDLGENDEMTMEAEQNVAIPYPFQIQVEKMKGSGEKGLSRNKSDVPE